MRLRPSFVLTAFVLCAGPAAGAELLMERAAPCLAAPDRAMCLLKVAAEADGGSDIWRDPELRGQPQIMAALGLTARGVAAARGVNENERLFFGAMDDAEAAVEEALALDRAGRPTADALKPILELSTAAPPVPPFFAGGGEMPSARAEAFMRLLGEAPEGSRPSAALARAAADAWEQEISRPGASPAARAGAVPLARARQALGDEAGVARALRLVASPTERVRALAELGRIEDAVATALVLPKPEVLAAVRAEMTAEAARLVGLQQSAAAGMLPFLEEKLREARGQGQVEMAKLIEGMIAEQRRAGPPEIRAPAISQEEVVSEADDRIGLMQDAVLRAAARQGRAEAARPLVDRLLQDERLVQNRYRFPLVLKAANREAAAARLEALETGLTPRRGAERLEPIVDGWTAIGRPERGEALIARVRPWAQPRRPGYAQPLARLLHARGRTAEARTLAELRLDEMIAADIAAGRGLANFDAYRAEAKDEGGVVTLVVHCASAAEKARAWPLAIACAERHAALLTHPQQRYALAGSALRLAVRAADDGDEASARRLTDMAFEAGLAGLAADPQIRGWPDPVTGWALISIAKAELRASGRLPPKAAAS